MQSIHCKVSCNEQEFRRFLFVGTEFSSLFSQVQQLLALDKEFVLKYKDVDGDLITLTSNEELACALGYSDGNILRLVAVPKDATVTVGSDVCSPDFHCARKCREQTHGGHPHGPMHGGHGGYPLGQMHGGHPHGPMHGGGHHGHGHPSCHGEMFKAKLISKRDFFKTQLDELEKAPEKTPEQQQQILRLQFKLKKIECLLEGGWEKKGKHCEKWVAKKEKRRQKYEKKMRKGDKKDKCSNLSEEAQTQIAILKSQIDVIKPGMKETKSQIKAKKRCVERSKSNWRRPTTVAQGNFCFERNKESSEKSSETSERKNS